MPVCDQPGVVPVEERVHFAEEGQWLRVEVDGERVVGGRQDLSAAAVAVARSRRRGSEVRRVAVAPVLTSASDWFTGSGQTTQISLVRSTPPADRSVVWSQPP